MTGEFAAHSPRRISPVFYGAVFGGIAEMFHAWVLTPKQPTYLEDH